VITAHKLHLTWVLGVNGKYQICFFRVKKCQKQAFSFNEREAKVYCYAFLHVLKRDTCIKHEKTKPNALARTLKYGWVHRGPNSQSVMPVCIGLLVHIFNCFSITPHVMFVVRLERCESHKLSNSVLQDII
jgi:hypothetical protein